MNFNQQVLIEQPSENNIQKKYASIVIITWNLHGALPPQKQLIKLISKINNQDLIFFLTQQCQNSLFYSFFIENKAEWENLLRNTISKTHQLVYTEVMQGIHTAVLIKTNLIKQIKLLRSSKYKAGFLNIFGNKGAISIEASLFGSKFQVINCHLAPHHSQTQRRNEVLIEILTHMVGKKTGEIFIAGDLNYRIDIKEEQYQELLKGNNKTESIFHHQIHLSKDQLNLQPTLRKNFLSLFQEGKIQFPPTYKISANSNQYNPHRIPGWTDRIFYKKNKGKQKYYISEHHILGSDHRPVLGCYEIEIEDNIQQERIENVTQRCNLI